MLLTDDHRSSFFQSSSRGNPQRVSPNASQYSKSKMSCRASGAWARRPPPSRGCTPPRRVPSRPPAAASAGRTAPAPPTSPAPRRIAARLPSWVRPQRRSTAPATAETCARTVVVDGDQTSRVQERERVVVPSIQTISSAISWQSQVLSVVTCALWLRSPGAVDDGVGDNGGAVGEHHLPVLAQAIDLHKHKHSCRIN